MSHTRRAFFGLLAGAAVAPLVPIPELLPSTRTIFLPPRGGWHSNLLTAELIRKEALRILHENMRFVSDYDIDRNVLIGRHDILVGDLQLAVDHMLAPGFPIAIAKDQAASLFLDRIQHDGLSVLNIKRPPRYGK